MLSLMHRNSVKYGRELDLRIEDAEGNNLLHMIFSQFSNNMEVSVELCQELFTICEKHKL